MNSVFAKFHEITPEEFKRVTEVTYLGQVYATMTALKYMRPRNKGSIVLVGSALAYRGIPLQSAYCGAKHGIQGMFDSLKAEFMHDNLHIRLCMVHLPALNTTQFGWVKSKLPNKPRPMGKIFQPEVAAKAIVYASQHTKRELYVAYPTFQSIIGNKLLPSLGDYVLAKSGISGQQTDEPEKPDRKDNLWDYVPGNHSSHGTFDELAHDRSPLVWVATNWRWLQLILFFMVLLILILIIS